MKLLHLSDLHLGKRVNGFDLAEDQAYILAQILDRIDETKPDAVLIAGDVYDRAVPSAGAVRLFDDFLFDLAKRAVPALILCGNHDAPQRLAYAGRLLEKDRLYLSPVYDGAVTPVTLSDADGPVDFWLLPFLKPATVRACFPEAEIGTYTDALQTAIDALPLDRSRRNVLVAHQFVTGAQTSDSEEISVGGLENVDAAVFAPFDYVALGHLHGPQSLCGGRLRYCGSPLKYSGSEAGQTKSLSLVTLAADGTPAVEALPFCPLRDLRKIRGTYAELTDRRTYEGTAREDYLFVTLTDETEIYDAIGKLRTVYPNLMELRYENARTAAGGDLAPVEAAVRPEDLFARLYEQQNGRPMSEAQAALIRELTASIWGEDA